MTAQSQDTLTLPGGTLTVRAFAASDRGSVRKVNEDSLFARFPVYAVADGMGGHQFGDRASQTVVARFSDLFPSERRTRPELVLDAIGSANDAVLGLVDEMHAPGTVAGTTVTGVALVETGNENVPHWMVFNVGDSRVYGWDGRALRQLTTDHSAVQELVNHGLITPSQAAVHPERNVITRAVGTHASVEADYWLIPVGGHQVFLVCSDGLSKELVDEQLAGFLSRLGPGAADVAGVGRDLVAAALASGGRDNVTVVVLESEFHPNPLSYGTDWTAHRIDRAPTEPAHRQNR